MNLWILLNNFWRRNLCVVLVVCCRCRHGWIAKQLPPDHSLGWLSSTVQMLVQLDLLAARPALTDCCCRLHFGAGASQSSSWCCCCCCWWWSELSYVTRLPMPDAACSSQKARPSSSSGATVTATLRTNPSRPEHLLIWGKIGVTRLPSYTPSITLKTTFVVVLPIYCVLSSLPKVKLKIRR